MRPSEDGRPRRSRAALSFALVGLLLTASSLGWTLFVVLPSWNAGATCVAGVPHERSSIAPKPALARRVYVVLVDGLGFEAARQLDALGQLRAEGAFRRLDVDFPTFTSPAVTTMVVGQGPRESGVRLNGAAIGAGGLDSIAATAWDAGTFVRVRSRTFEPFQALVRPPHGADVVGGRWSMIADLALLRALPPPTSSGDRATDLTFVHIGEVDDAGHLCGSDCAEYGAASADAAGLLVTIADHLDRDRDLLIALSDHATLESRGHGGDEPILRGAFLLAWGANVERGVELEPRPMRDVPSTLAVAMGVHTPSSNLGAPQLDLFDLDEAERSKRLAEPFDQASRYACAVRRTPLCDEAADILASLEAGAGEPRATAFIAALSEDRERAAAEADADARWLRAAVAVAFAALAVWAVSRWFAAMAWPRGRSGFLAPLAVLGAYSIVLLFRGYGPSLSAMAGAEVFVPHAIEAGVAGGAALVVAGYLARWSEREAGFALFAVVIALLPLWAFTGADPAAIPPPTAGCLALQLTPLVAAASLGAVGLALLRQLASPLTREGGRGGESAGTNAGEKTSSPV